MRTLLGILPFILVIALSCTVTAKGNKSGSGYKNKEKHTYNENKDLKEQHKYKKNAKHSKTLPPGLRKKVARGKELPPGWQKKIRRGEVLDYDIYQGSSPIDFTKHPKIFPGDPTTEVIRIHNKILRIMNDTREVVDILQ